MRPGAALALAVALTSGACAAPRRSGSFVTIPVTFQSHLLTARKCELRALVTGQTMGPDANVLLTFAYSTESSSYQSTHHDATFHMTAYTESHSRYSSEKGKALKCPLDVVQQLVMEMERQPQ